MEEGNRKLPTASKRKMKIKYKMYINWIDN